MRPSWIRRRGRDNAIRYGKSLKTGNRDLLRATVPRYDTTPLSFKYLKRLMILARQSRHLGAPMARDIITKLPPQASQESLDPDNRLSRLRLSTTLPLIHSIATLGWQFLHIALESSLFLSHQRHATTFLSTFDLYIGNRESGHVSHCASIDTSSIDVMHFGLHIGHRESLMSSMYVFVGGMRYLCRAASMLLGAGVEISRFDVAHL